MPNAADSIRNPLPFGQNASYLKFYVFDSTSEFGFVFAILSSRWSVHYHQCTDYLQRSHRPIAAVPDGLTQVPLSLAYPTGRHGRDLHAPLQKDRAHQRRRWNG